MIHDVSFKVTPTGYGKIMFPRRRPLPILKFFQNEYSMTVLSSEWGDRMDGYLQKKIENLFGFRTRKNDEGSHHVMAPST